MYKGHSIWDEEQEKYENIIPDKEDSPEYHDQKEYNAGEQSDIYNKEKGEEDEKKKEATGIERNVEKEEKKYEKKEEATEEDVKKKAASDVHEGTKSEDGKKGKKEHKSIEDAINKAMKEEKELIYVDD